jgi:GNAT superfamily N-acetyltransferase
MAGALVDRAGCPSRCGQLATESWPYQLRPACGRHQMHSTELEPGTPGFVVRPPQGADAAAIARLAGELGFPAGAEQMRARLEVLASLCEHWIGVAARPEGAPLGWIHVARCWTLQTGEFALILGLVVAAEARRAGVGRALVAAAERWSRESGLERITVRSNVLRSESHQFYPSLGYARQKSQHVYVKTLTQAPAGDAASSR